MGSESNSSSSGEGRSTVFNFGENNVTNKIEEHEYDKITNSEGKEEKTPNGHKYYVSSIHYYYQTIGSHRIIKIGLDCNKCCDGWWLYMDKTSDASKNIDISREGLFKYLGSNYHWSRWDYYYDHKNFDYEDCLRLYHNAPSGYSFLLNNCADFARYIWNNAPY